MLGLVQTQAARPGGRVLHSAIKGQTHTLSITIHATNGYGGYVTQRASCDFINGKFDASWTKFARRMGGGDEEIWTLFAASCFRLETKRRPLCRELGREPGCVCRARAALEEAGLVGAAVQVVQQRGTAALVWRLTWAGHEFADAISSDTLWRKAKDSVIKPTGSWTFGVLLDYLKSEIARGLPSLPL